MSVIVGIDFGSMASRTALFRDGQLESCGNRFSDGRQTPLIELPGASSTCPGLNGLPVGFVSLKQKAGGEEMGVSHGIGTIFRQLLEDVRIAVAEPISGAVIAVPGFFPERPRLVLRKAALNADFPAVKLFDDALAAVMGTENLPDRGSMLVYALGAGVFSVSVLRMTNGKPRVLSSEGNRFLGGADFDAALIGLVLDRLGRTPDLSAYKESIPRLKALAEQLKISLSKREKEEFELDIGELFGEGGVVNLTVTRHEFEETILAAVESTVAQARKAVGDAGLSPDSIESVLMTGGSTRIPLVERLLTNEFPVPLVRAGDVNIARGAARYGSQLELAEWKRKETEDPAPESPAPFEAPPVVGGTWAAMFNPHFQDAETLWNRGEKDKAIGTLEEMMQQCNMYLGTLHHEIGKDLFREGRYDEAMARMKRALKSSPADKHALQTYHESMNQKARQLLEVGKLIDARAMIRQALELNSRCEGCRGVAERIEQAISKSRGFNPKHWRKSR